MGSKPRIDKAKKRIYIGKGEMQILKVLIESGGCVDGLLELISKAYPRWHTKQYLRGLTKRVYRMEEKGLVSIEKVKSKPGRGRMRRRICLTSYGLKEYYARVKA